jgi:hypothetical protein
MKTVRAILEHRWVPILAAILAVVLTSPSLDNGFMLDDYFHRAVMLGSERFGDFLGGPQEMFRFFRGDPQRTHAAIDVGFLPWWTYCGVKAEFLQFLTVQTHVLDYALWPDSPWLMHLHSLLWLAALVLLVGLLYRRILGPGWVAGLAVLLFAVEDAHASPAGWICNRNVLLAATFGVACLFAHDRWARDRRWRWYVFALALWTASLLSKEAGIATSALVFAYVVWMQKDSWRGKLVSLVPYGVVLVLWRTVRDGLGYGVHGIGMYVDPLDEPSRFAAAMAQRAPALLAGQWAVPPSDAFIVLPPRISAPLWWWAVIVIVLLGALLWPLLRADRVARFFATAMLLAVVPICAAFPMDRLLTFVGIGAFGLLARFVQFAFSREQSGRLGAAYGAVAKFAAGALLGLHLGLAPIALTYRAAHPFGPPKMVEALHLRTDLPEEAKNQDLIVVNPPSPFHVSYYLITAELEGQVLPRHLRCLATGVTPMTVRREDAHTIVIRPWGGFMPMVLSRLVRNERHPMRVGEVVELTGMRVEVIETMSDGQPTAARFVFDVPLEDGSLRWLRWREGQFEEFHPPPVGEETTLTPPPLRRFVTGDYRP